MSYTTFFTLATAIFLWSSAYVGIRATYDCYSPEGLALLRYLIASCCIGIFYLRLNNKNKMPIRDRIALLLLGVIGIGVYNITLNRGELSVSSGVASFIVSQVPVLVAIIAFIFFGERFNRFRLAGFLLSIAGLALVGFNDWHAASWESGLMYLCIATLAGGCYTLLQKPYLMRYHAIETTAYVIWGGTLILLFYYPAMRHDLAKACLKSTLVVFYLGIFPAAIGYVAWSYALSKLEVARAASFLYFMPFIATLLGWLCLGETPVWMTLIGGALAMFGVWLVNYSYRVPVEIVGE